MTWFRDPAPASPDRDDESGFTLVELVVTIGLIAIVFTAVAGVLTSSLKALAVQKARTQGNEVATQAIEDLQRRSFDNLVLCTAPSGTAPTGLDDLVMGSGCPANTANYGEDPCNNLNPGQAPKAEYTCTRLSVAFNVKRYIAWTDDGHSNKRLAVFVKWTDNVGTHTVSQQSSLRAPTLASIIGLPNPTLNTASASNRTQINPDGTMAAAQAVSLSVKGTALTAEDHVFATFWDRASDGTLQIDSFPLTTADGGANWSGTITPADNFVFTYGSQVFTFKALRVKDGKTTSALAGISKFCVPSDSLCQGNVLPGVSVTSAPNSVALSASGGQTADYTLTVQTTNVSATGRVQALLPTLGGVSIIDMAPTSCTTSNNTLTCNWSVTIKKSAGYAYQAGNNQPVGFFAQQPYVQGSSTDAGSTASVETTVTYA